MERLASIPRERIGGWRAPRIHWTRWSERCICDRYGVIVVQIGTQITNENFNS